jgi:hypothetical protein
MTVATIGTVVIRPVTVGAIAGNHSTNLATVNNINGNWGVFLDDNLASVDS